MSAIISAYPSPMNDIGHWDSMYRPDINNAKYEWAGMVPELRLCPFQSLFGRFLGAI
jgi:hypothetical protein